MPQLTNRASGSDRNTSTCRDSLPGSQRSSSSQNATSSVSASAMPELRAPARPGERTLLVTVTVSRSSERSGSVPSCTTTQRTSPG